MKLEVTKAWCLAAARREGDAEVGAGILAFDPEPATKSEAQGPDIAAESVQIAFGRAVQLLRRQRALTIEKLADYARIDVAELVTIEADPHHRAEPRAVSKLAQVFGIDPKIFQQLAGNALARDARIRDEAVRFAARSGSVERLTLEENEAVEHFIAALSAMGNRNKPRS